MSRHFTIVLNDDDAAALLEIVKPFGGSIGGFCSEIVRDFVRLTPDQVHAVRLQTRQLAATCERNHCKNRR